MLSLVLSFAPKESTTPLGAAAPSSAPESARQALGRGSRMAKLAFLVACRGLSARHLSPSVRPLERQSSTPAGVGASIPRRDFPTAEGFACDKIGAALPAVNSVCCSPSAWNLRRNPHLLVTAPVCIGCIETSKKWKNLQAGERKKHGYTPALPLKNSKRPCSFWLHGRLC